MFLQERAFEICLWESYGKNHGPASAFGEHSPVRRLLDCYFFIAENQKLVENVSCWCAEEQHSSRTSCSVDPEKCSKSSGLCVHLNKKRWRKVPVGVGALKNAA